MIEQEILNGFMERIVIAKTEKELDDLQGELLSSYLDGRIQGEAELLKRIVQTRINDLRKLKYVESILNNAQEIINM